MLLNFVIVLCYHCSMTLLFSGSLSWAGDHLCSGSRDHSILQWDHRLPAFPTRRLLSHVQEVCGLKWSPDHQHLASGGNDNKLYIWSQSSTRPLHCFADHLAAVKAISWSPHQVCPSTHFGVQFHLDLS